MNLLSFIAQIIESLAWPFTIIIFAILFRKPLALLLPNIESLQHKNTIIKFARKTEKIGKEIDKQIPLQQPLELKVQVHEPVVITEETREEQISAKEPLRDIFDKIFIEVEKSPQLAIMQAWTKLEMEAILTLKRYNYFEKKGEISINSFALLKGLKSLQLLDKKQIQIFNDLRKLRNVAVHQVFRPIPEGIALSYIDAVKKMYIYLKNKNP